MKQRRSQEERSEAAVGRLLDAALGLFSTQGYRATTLRQIAEGAGVSVGNIYHHFPNKHAIYQRLIERYWERVLDPALPLNRIFARAAFPDDLEEMAEAIEQVVEQNADHILLVYVDVIEFGGENIHAFYEQMATRFRSVYSEPFERRQASGEFGEVDPMVAVMVATRWLFYFFTVEKCFGVPMHFGMEPKRATQEFVQLMRYGLLRRAEAASSTTESNERRNPARGDSAGARRSRSQGGGPK